MKNTIPAQAYIMGNRNRQKKELKIKISNVTDMDLYDEEENMISLRPGKTKQLPGNNLSTLLNKKYR